MIFIVTPYRVFPVKKGGQKFIALFMRYFSRHRPLTSLTVKGDPYPGWEGLGTIPVFSDSSLRYANPFNFFRLAGLIWQKKATHLILEHPYMGWLGLLLKWFTPVKLVIQSHNIEGQRWKSLGKWWWKILEIYEGFVHRNADMSFFIHDADKQFALKHYRVKPEKATVITYGIENSEVPTPAQKVDAAKMIRMQYGIPNSASILLFAGAFGYKPNSDAVKIILNFINPALKNSGIEYRILICGGGLAEDLKKEIMQFPEIIYAGFVDDIDTVFMGADVFINPVLDGGGIKTKLVEALGGNTPAVSTDSGAIGVDEVFTGDMLRIVADGDWEALVKAICKTISEPRPSIPSKFYDQFYWGNIAEKAAKVLDEYA